MRFGLHAGWAIEGAVGSRHKVDATYLSPHVNLAARMETAATQYGVPVLMTDSFYQILSTDPRKWCRKLDVITVKGSATPRSIYTFDAHPGPLSALPSRSAFKTYSTDVWKKDKVRKKGGEQNTWPGKYILRTLALQYAPPQLSLPPFLARSLPGHPLPTRERRRSGSIPFYFRGRPHELHQWPLGPGRRVLSSV